ncbi:MAG: hypothetical protein HY526_08150 [Betaproteobacteria bacterium]|nr:hypothetical protein [Betaproteobacteria bacterium]
MLLALKIGVFYGAPLVALVLAIAYFVVLLVRVRRGAIGRKKAAVRYSSTLLLAPATLIVVWGTAELTGYFAVPSGQYVWNASAAMDSLISLLPIAAYVGIPIAVLVLAFWSALAFSKAA